MKKLFFLICLCLFGVSSYAQDTIFAIQKNVAKSGNPVVILIPDSVLNANVTFDQNKRAYLGEQIVLRKYSETWHTLFLKKESKVIKTLLFNEKTGKNEIRTESFFPSSDFSLFLPMLFFMAFIFSFLFSWASGVLEFGFWMRAMMLIAAVIFLLISCIDKEIFLIASSTFLGAFISYIILCLTFWREEIKMLIQEWKSNKEKKSIISNFMKQKRK